MRFTIKTFVLPNSFGETLVEAEGDVVEAEGDVRVIESNDHAHELARLVSIWLSPDGRRMGSRKIGKRTFAPRWYYGPVPTLSVFIPGATDTDIANAIHALIANGRSEVLVSPIHHTTTRKVMGELRITGQKLTGVEVG